MKECFTVFKKEVPEGIVCKCGSDNLVTISCTDKVYKYKCRVCKEMLEVPYESKCHTGLLLILGWVVFVGLIVLAKIMM
jgi:hypothetical protein